MKQIELNINGETYPCTPTMGAMLRFKQETGKEITEIDANSLTEVCTYLWCCVASAAKREGKEFSLSLMDFADSITPEEMEIWGQTISQSQRKAATKEKKSK